MMLKCLFVKFWVHAWYCAELATLLFFLFMFWPTALSYNSGYWWKFWREVNAASVIHTDMHLPERPITAI